MKQNEILDFEEAIVEVLKRFKYSIDNITYTKIEVQAGELPRIKIGYN